MRKRLLVVLSVFTLALGLILPAMALASDSAIITVTATGEYIDISLDVDTWSVNGGTPLIANTTYYSQPSNYTTMPSDPVVDGECSHNLTNNSTIAVDITIKFDDMSGAGNPWVNSDNGTNAVMVFGSKAQGSGSNWTNAVVAKESASYNTLMSSLGSGLSKKLVVSFVSPISFEDGNPKSGNITLTATKS